MLNVLCLLCFIGLAFGSEGNLTADDAVDQLIVTVLQKLHKEKLDEVPLESLNIKWKYHWLSGSLRCSQGWMRSIGSLKKAARVNVTHEFDTTILTVPLRLENLEYGFQSCTYKLLHSVNWKGTVTVTARKNSLQAQATINRENVCEALLTSITVNDISNMDIRNTGHFAGSLLPFIRKPLEDFMHEQVAAKIIEKLQIVAPLGFSTEFLCDNIH